MKHSVKRTLAALMAAAISASMLPSMAFAADGAVASHKYKAQNVQFDTDGSRVTYDLVCEDGDLPAESKEVWADRNSDFIDGSNSKAATCTNDGLTVYTATLTFPDNTTEEVHAYATIPATGHKWATQESTETLAASNTQGDPTYQLIAVGAPQVIVHYNACENCDAKNIASVETVDYADSYTNAPWNAQMNGEVLNKYNNKCADDQCVSDGEREVIVKQPTCTEAGLKVTFDRCGTCYHFMGAKTETIPAKGHDWNQSRVLETVKPTCTEDGYKVVLARCNDCDAVEKQVVVDKNTAGHKYVVKEVEDTATCEKSGLKTYKVLCTVCGEEVPVGTEMKDITIDADKSDANVPADMTKYDGAWQVYSAKKNHVKETVNENVVEPTCDKAGSHDVVTKCKYCGYEFSRQHVTDKATGKHEYQVENPTIEWSNYRTEKDMDVLAGQEQPKAALVAKCANCDASLAIVDALKKVHEDDKTYVAPKAPKVTVKEDFSKRVEPTYTCKGGSKTFDVTIEFDGQTYTDSKTFVYVRYASDVTKLGNHVNMAPTAEITKEATCTEAGEKATVTRCKNCGEIVSKTNVEVIPAKGHSYGEFVVTTPATYTAEGVKTKTCTVCGDEQTESIAKLTVTKQKLGYVHNTATRRMQVNFQKFNPGDDYSVKYQIRYATNKSFTKGVKNVYTVKSTKTISGMTKGRTYYVKVRTHVYDADGNEVARGKYSEVTKITIKK